MKFFCKKKLVLGLLCFLCISFFASCSSVVDSNDQSVLYPDKNHAVLYKLYPNDMAKNDSAAVNLARGVMLVVHPGASYKLSFDIDSTQPVPELQLFRTFVSEKYKGQQNYGHVRTLSPIIVGNRYVYSFTCEENKMSTWITTLGVDGKYYEGNVENVLYSGIGSYSDHLSLNLIVVGSMEKTKDSMDIDELSRFMLNTFREKYYGVFIDTLYVRYAHDHPTLGYKYPANYPWVAGLNSEDITMNELAVWPEDSIRNALSVVLVHSINEENVLGCSNLFSAVLGADNATSVVIGKHVKKKGGEYELLFSQEIAMTAVHEMGHFLGLRHTSATRYDLDLVFVANNGEKYKAGDWSNIEDGMTDTPFCEYILNSGLYKQSDERDDVDEGFVLNQTLEYGSFSVKSGIFSCPDLDNIMFPVTLDGSEKRTFSRQQMELIRSTFSIIPH